MNVYDFDETIYYGDSTVDFFKYCLIHHPVMAVTLPNTGIQFLRYFAKRQSKTRCKEQMYRFLRCIGDTPQVVEQFWESHIGKIKPWYIQKLHKPDDVVISASPEFLVAPACKMLGISNVMASRVDPYTGLYEGVNCWGEEKVRRFYEVFGDGTPIDAFYSDSLSDTPLARLAQEAWIVRDDQLVHWDVWEQKHGKKKLMQETR
ncbi:MAG: HAD-IB family phosphatase [Butyricicoccus sp.]